MRRLRLVTALTAASAVILLALPVQAANITFENITGTWSNAAPNVASYTNNGTNVATARWGIPNPPGGSQSGYRFDGEDDFSVPVPPNPSSIFDLGEFTHFNQPIDLGSSIDSIRLTVGADVSVDATSVGNLKFVFDFTHLETNNTVNPCPNGEDNGDGVNVNGCADRVTFGYNELSDSFDVGGVLYTLTLAGFVDVDDPTNEQVSEYWTKETKNNKARLLGQIVTREEANPIPEPTTLVLLGTGLLSLAARSRRRR